MATKPARQRGAAAVEFALICTAFLALLFALIEYGRMLFLWNALPEVTRRAARAAAVTDFSDAAAMLALRQAALIGGGGGALPLAPNVTHASIRIEYLWQDTAGNRFPLPVLPDCPIANRLSCANNPHSADCIRFVRVSLCDNGAANCPALQYQPLMPMLLGSVLPATLPRATVTMPVESLGYTPGQAPCP